MTVQIDIIYLEGQLEVNKQLLRILEMYIKKAGEWNGPMIARLTEAREALETQQALCAVYRSASNLKDNLPSE